MSSATVFEKYIKTRWQHRLDDPQGGGHPVPYPMVAALGFSGETGEVVEAVLHLVTASGKSTELLKKHYRDGKHPGEALKLELGDVLHYLTVIAQSYGWTLEDLMVANVEKLAARDAHYEQLAGRP